MWLSVPLLGASGARGSRRGVRPAQMRSSAASFAEISPEVILRDEWKNGVIFVWYETYMPYDPTVAHISTHISALGNTPVLIHFTLCIVWHIDQSEPIEHSVDVGHAPDIAQRFWTVNHCSDLFHIAQRQQHRAPRQTFAVFPAVDPEFPCVFAASAFSYFIREALYFTAFFSPWRINLEPNPDCHFSRCQSTPPDVKSWTTNFTNFFLRVPPQYCSKPLIFLDIPPFFTLAVYFFAPIFIFTDDDLGSLPFSIL